MSITVGAIAVLILVCIFAAGRISRRLSDMDELVAQTHRRVNGFADRVTRTEDRADNALAELRAFRALNATDLRDIRIASGTLHGRLKSLEQIDMARRKHTRAPK